MIKRVAHLCISADDLEATQAFYVGALGMTTRFRFMKKKELYGFYLDAGGGTFIEVFRRGDEPKGTGTPIRHFCLEVDDIQAARKKMMAAGVEVTEPKLGCDNSLQVWFKDPSGIAIELHQYTERSAQRLGGDVEVTW